MIRNRNYDETDGRGTAKSERGRDEVLRALARSTRRRVLRYLDEAGGDVDVTELAGHLADEQSVRERTAASLHHVHLPKLDDCGLVEYDPESCRVATTVPPWVEQYLELVD